MASESAVTPPFVDPQVWSLAIKRKKLGWVMSEYLWLMTINREEADVIFRAHNSKLNKDPAYAGFQRGVQYVSSVNEAIAQRSDNLQISYRQSREEVYEAIRWIVCDMDRYYGDRAPASFYGKLKSLYRLDRVLFCSFVAQATKDIAKRFGPKDPSLFNVIEPILTEYQRTLAPMAGEDFFNFGAPKDAIAVMKDGTMVSRLRSDTSYAWLSDRSSAFGGRSLQNFRQDMGNLIWPLIMQAERAGANPSPLLDGMITSRVNAVHDLVMALLRYVYDSDGPMTFIIDGWPDIYRLGDPLYGPNNIDLRAEIINPFVKDRIAEYLLRYPAPVAASGSIGTRSSLPKAAILGALAGAAITHVGMKR